MSHAPEINFRNAHCGNVQVVKWPIFLALKVFVSDHGFHELLLKMCSLHALMGKRTKKN